MIFDRLPLEEAEGAILAHAVEAGPLGLLKKGYVLDDVALQALRDAGQKNVLAAKLEPGDIPEDEAAYTIAKPLAGPNVIIKPPFTGRSNLHSSAYGVARINRTLINKINMIDPSITIATVKDYEKVDEGQMLATIKIIPFSTTKDNMEIATSLAENDPLPLVTIHPFQKKKIGVISTRLPKTPEKLIIKSEQVLSDRLEACQNKIFLAETVPHHEDDLSETLQKLVYRECELILIFGASAITDIRDVVPTAIQKIGGHVDHFGMPVDPGNLLLLGHIGESIVVGLPGCTRSPKMNGFDWILERLLADLSVDPEDIMNMGEGGLLKEIASRPQPRDRKAPPVAEAYRPKIAVLLLAAGQSRRMGAQNKLLALVDGKPMVRHVAEQALASRADHVLMVTGHEADSVLKTVWDIDVASVQNPDYADGLSTSLKLGFEILQKEYDGILVCLGDMPFVSHDILDQLIDAFNPEEGRAIILPSVNGKRGNPALISSQFYSEVMEVIGDLGAKALISNNDHIVHTIEIDSSSIFADIDTPEILAQVTEELTKKSE